MTLSDVFADVCATATQDADHIECFLRDTKGGTVCYRNAAQHTATITEWRTNRYGLLLAPVEDYIYSDKEGLLYATLR